MEEGARVRNRFTVPRLSAMSASAPFQSRCGIGEERIGSEFSDETIPSSHLMGSGMVSEALQALQNGFVPSRRATRGDPGCEHLFKAIHDLPVPFRAALPNPAVKYRLGHKETPAHRRERWSAATPNRLPPRAK
jgi:hypothetical protein